MAMPSLRSDKPAKPNTAVIQIPPRAAMCTPPSIAAWVSARSIAAGLPEVAQRHFGVAQSRSNEPVHGAAQRAAVAAARLVVIEVLRPCLADELLRQQPQQRHDIGLLDHLGFLRPLSPKHHVHWHGTAGIVRQIDVFESEIARELLEQSRFADQGRSPSSPRRSATASARCRPRRGGMRGVPSVRASARAAMPPHRAHAGCSSVP